MYLIWPFDWWDGILIQQVHVFNLAFDWLNAILIQQVHVFNLAIQPVECNVHHNSTCISIRPVESPNTVSL